MELTQILKFIAHPMPSFVPANVPRAKVAYLPATTDWLDGLNKPIAEWDMKYYGHLYNMECLKTRITPLDYPARQYFIQVARFDPAKGIPDVLRGYAEFRRRLSSEDASKASNPPQLLIVGNSSIDDPDGTMIYDATMTLLETEFSDLTDSVSIMRLPPNDQLLNTLISNAHTVLQLSTREGFEVKVSEALHKGIPVIATNVGGIPLQMQDGKNGYLVEAGDWEEVGNKLMWLWEDKSLHERMSHYAGSSVSDEVGTVGNALSWFYLAAMAMRKKADKEEEDEEETTSVLKPEGRWVNDMAREEAVCPYEVGENKISRASTLIWSASGHAVHESKSET